MPNEDKNISADAIRSKAEKFLSLKWVGAMHSYTRTIDGMNAPVPPPDQPGMIVENRHKQPILTVPALMARAQKNARRWEPLLGEMMDVARPIKEYATLAIVTVEEISAKTKKELAAEEWAKLSAQDRERLAAELSEMVADLKDAALRNCNEATKMRDTILAYKNDLILDHDESGDVQTKYKDWLAAEDKILAVWEEDHNLQPGETQMLIEKLQEDVQNFNVKWAGLTGGAVGAAGGTVGFGLVVFPPFGAIAGLIAMSVMAAQAAQFKREMDEFQGRLDRVKKFNAVKVFFSTMDSMLQRIMDAIENAAEALSEIAGLWSIIAADLKSVMGTTIGVGGLSGSVPWQAPVRLTKKLGLQQAYRTLIADCDVFVQYAYVQDIRTIDSSKRR